MDLGENEELREALLGADGDDDLEFYITFPTPTALVTKTEPPVCDLCFFRIYSYSSSVLSFLKLEHQCWNKMFIF